jgi:hypothetical protein
MNWPKNIQKKTGTWVKNVEKGPLKTKSFWAGILK